MPRRAEDELMRMSGRNPMDVGPPGGMGMEPPVGPPDMPMEPPMSPDQMMMEPGMEDPMDAGLPHRAMVVALEGENVKLQTDDGLIIDLPYAVFPVPPSEGSVMVQSEVLDVTPEQVIIGVGEAREPTPVPTAQLQDVFNVGELVWMPEMPMGPDMMQEPMGGGMGGPPPGGMGGPPGGMPGPMY